MSHAGHIEGAKSHPASAVQCQPIVATVIGGYPLDGQRRVSAARDCAVSGGFDRFMLRAGLLQGLTDFTMQRKQYHSALFG
jgi:hypothetical protein